MYIYIYREREAYMYICVYTRPLRLELRAYRDAVTQRCGTRASPHAVLYAATCMCKL